MEASFKFFNSNLG